MLQTEETREESSRVAPSEKTNETGEVKGAEESKSSGRATGFLLAKRIDEAKTSEGAKLRACSKLCWNLEQKE